MAIARTQQLTIVEVNILCSGKLYSQSHTTIPFFNFMKNRYRQFIIRTPLIIKIAILQFIRMQFIIHSIITRNL